MLGNFFHEHGGHGHLHIVPRYAPHAKPLVFMNMVFEDDRWGKNYTPETPMEIPRDVLAGIITTLKDALE